MRKIISILLFSLLCITLLGYHLVFSFQIASVKSEMKAFLKSQQKHKDVVQLSLNENESKQVYWEDDEEFSYQDEMYDVVEKTVNGNTTIIRCIPDEKETSLLNEYQKNNKRNSSNSTIVQLIATQFVLPADYLPKPTERLVKNYYKNYSSSLQNIASTVLLPPPDVC